MNRLGCNGLLLMGVATITYLVSEFVGTAYASRPQTHTVAIAVSSGPELTLKQRTSLQPLLARNPESARTLYCRSVISVGGVSFGYDCQPV